MWEDDVAGENRKQLKRICANCQNRLDNKTIKNNWALNAWCKKCNNKHFKNYMIKNSPWYKNQIEDRERMYYGRIYVSPWWIKNPGYPKSRPKFIYNEIFHALSSTWTKAQALAFGLAEYKKLKK